jgi:hypothetical protein
MYECRITEKKFERLKKIQSLNFSFSNLLVMLIKQLNLTVRHPDQFITVIYLNKVPPHSLTILENI